VLFSILSRWVEENWKERGQVKLKREQICTGFGAFGLRSLQKCVEKFIFSCLARTLESWKDFSVFWCWPGIDWVLQYSRTRLRFRQWEASSKDQTRYKIMPEYLGDENELLHILGSFIKRTTIVYLLTCFLRLVLCFSILWSNHPLKLLVRIRTQ